MVQDFLAFLTQSPTPYHAVANLVRMLREEGKFERLPEVPTATTCLQANGRYFITRNGSALVAFVNDAGSGQGGPRRCVIAGTHSDSPCLKLKVNQTKPIVRDGFLQVPLETYGGGLWHTWFDRDLGLAGRMQIVRSDDASKSSSSFSSATPSTKPHIKEVLVNIDRPLLRVPSLAIHLDRTCSPSEGFKFNPELQLQAVLSVSAEDATQCEPDGEQLLHAVLRRAVGEALSPEDASPAGPTVVGHDLCLYDCTPAKLSGLDDELIVSGRLDNLFMTYCAIRGLLNGLSHHGGAVIRMVAVFDCEEVGSEMPAGADGNLLPAVLAAYFPGVDMSASLLVSADMAHSVHPNYADKHDQSHRPCINRGVVFKHHSGARYATTSRASAALRHFLMAYAGDGAAQPVKLQSPFMVRNDSPCGSTIGPMLSAKLGVPCVDLGLPQLAMHSCREVAGTDDLGTGVALFAACFSQPSALLDSLILDH